MEVLVVVEEVMVVMEVIVVGVWVKVVVGVWVKVVIVIVVVRDDGSSSAQKVVAVLVFSGSGPSQAGFVGSVTSPNIYWR